VISRSEKNTQKRLRSLARGLRPVVKRFREIIAADAGQISSAGLEALKLAFRELQLDSDNETDWKTLAAVLAAWIFDEGKKRGPPEWRSTQQMELLSEVHERKQRNPSLSIERICELIAKDKNSPSYFRKGLRGADAKGSGLVKQLRKARLGANNLARVAYWRAFDDTGRN
jgi:hypothetical protein